MSRHRFAVASSAVFAVLGVGAVGVAAAQANGAFSDANSLSDRGSASGAAHSGATVTRQVTESGVTWTITRTESSAGPCIGVTATLNGEEQGTVGGGCGHPDKGSPRWGIGGLDVAGAWFNVAYGELEQAVTDTVRVTLTDGRVLTETGGQSGLWAAAYPANATDASSDVSRIDVVDAAGASVASAKVPSLAAIRARAKEMHTQVTHSGPHSAGPHSQSLARARAHARATHAHVRDLRTH